MRAESGCRDVKCCPAALNKGVATERSELAKRCQDGSYRVGQRGPSGREPAREPVQCSPSFGSTSIRPRAAVNPVGIPSRSAHSQRAGKCCEYIGCRCGAGGGNVKEAGLHGRSSLWLDQDANADGSDERPCQRLDVASLCLFSAYSAGPFSAVAPVANPYPEFRGKGMMHLRCS